MMETEAQLQLFEMPAAGRIRRTMAPVGRLELRHDHVILLGILGLIGIAAIFACGVERGKQLARVERMLIVPSSASSAASSSASSTSSTERSLDRAGSPAASTPDTERAGRSAPKPVGVPRGQKRLASPTTRFAIQVVSYSKPELAVRELKRLQAHGEAAFLLTQERRAVLLVGPFPSRQHAAKRLSTLKQRYQDCFVRNL